MKIDKRFINECHELKVLFAGEIHKDCRQEYIKHVEDELNAPFDEEIDYGTPIDVVTHNTAHFLNDYITALKIRNKVKDKLLEDGV